jgi:predicted peptidase
MKGAFMSARRLVRSLVCLSWLLLLPALAQAGEQSGQRFTTTLTREAALDYLLYLPPGYAAEGAPKALVLFLHGAGERGRDLEKLKENGPPKLIALGKAFDAIVVSPQCPEGSFWTEHTETLARLLDDLEARYNVDPRRIYVTGLSMGGYGTWDLLIAQPERFAAAIPICGGGRRIRARALVDLPIWVFHGDADPLVPLAESIDMFDAIRRAGGTQVRLTVLPATGHDSWTAAYDDPAVWDWLFAQRRPAE